MLDVMPENKEMDKIESFRRFKRFRWIVYLAIVSLWLLNAFSEFQHIHPALKHGFSLSEIFAASGYAMSSFPKWESPILVCAGIHLHMLLASILFGVMIFAGTVYCFSLQDMVIKKHEEKA